jgi:hypothetical protein
MNHKTKATYSLEWREYFKDSQGFQSRVGIRLNLGGALLNNFFYRELVP